MWSPCGWTTPRQPNSRWYSGSGIYRHVWLTLTGPLHVGPGASIVTTPRVDSAERRCPGSDPRGQRPRSQHARRAPLPGAGRRRARSRPRRDDLFGARRQSNWRSSSGCSVTTPRLWSVETPEPVHAPHRKYSMALASIDATDDDLRHSHHRLRQGPRLPAERPAGQAARRQPAPRRRRGGRGGAGAGLGAAGWSRSRRWA